MIAELEFNSMAIIKGDAGSIELLLGKVSKVYSGIFGCIMLFFWEAIKLSGLKKE